MNDSEIFLKSRELHASDWQSFWNPRLRFSKYNDGRWMPKREAAFISSRAARRRKWIVMNRKWFKQWRALFIPVSSSSQNIRCYSFHNPPNVALKFMQLQQYFIVEYSLKHSVLMAKARAWQRAMPPRKTQAPKNRWMSDKWNVIIFYCFAEMLAIGVVNKEHV